MKTSVHAGLEAVEFYRAQERAAYERWRGTSSSEHVLATFRKVAWHCALRGLNAELARHALAGLGETRSKVPVIKRCSCCGAEYTADSWPLLPFVGDQLSETEEGAPAVLEMRNCPCGSTICIERMGVEAGVAA